MSYTYDDLFVIDGVEKVEPFTAINDDSMDGIRWILERDTVFICEMLRKDSAFMTKFMSKFIGGTGLSSAELTVRAFLDELLGCIRETEKRHYFMECIVEYIRSNYHTKSAAEMREALCRIHILTEAGITDGLNNHGLMNSISRFQRPGYLIIHLFSGVLTSWEFRDLAKRVYTDGSVTTYGDLFNDIMDNEIAVLSHLFAFHVEDKVAISNLMKGAKNPNPKNDNCAKA